MAKHLTGPTGHGFPVGGPVEPFVSQLKLNRSEAILIVVGKATGSVYPFAQLIFPYIIKLQPFSKMNLRRCIVNWIVQSDQPFSEIESPAFRQMIFCASGVMNKDLISSHSTISADVKVLHAFAAEWIKEKASVNKIINKIFHDTILL
jgi:hypothetical protein